MQCLWQDTGISVCKRTLSRAGVQIISGMAYGIDAEAHKGALEGKTPDICDSCKWSRYLLSCRKQKSLSEDYENDSGGIISEYPAGTRARNYFFPAQKQNYQRAGRSGADC